MLFQSGPIILIYFSRIWAHGKKFVGALLKFEAYLGSLIKEVHFFFCIL